MWLEEIDFCDPVEIFESLANIPGSVFLDSALVSNSARYSYIAVDPFLQIHAKNNEITINQEKIFGNPFDVLQKYLKSYSFDIDTSICPFQGGVVGYFGYGLSQHLETLSKPPIDDFNFPDLCIGFYDVVIGFDLQLQKAWIFSSGYPEETSAAKEKRALSRMDFVREEISAIAYAPFEKGGSTPGVCRGKRGILAKKNPPVAQTKSEDPPFQRGCELSSNFTQSSYESAVKKCIQYIKAGDIFEVNISQRFTTQLDPEDDPFALYKRLRNINPAPFAAYLNFSPLVLASASPERFLKLQNKNVETKPIKGTLPRGNTAEEDYALAQQLLTSEKDRAENIMIVDLMRNDLSRVCENHSINVSQLCALNSFPTVHHLVSTVEGKLCENADAVDLLKATFPGGSVTGAPKIRAMEIITEIEKINRGPYCGSIGFIGFNGDMDCSITIRTFALQDRQVSFQVGGAVVCDSDPLEEYEETLYKGRALMEALSSAPTSRGLSAGSIEPDDKRRALMEALSSAPTSRGLSAGSIEPHDKK